MGISKNMELIDQLLHVNQPFTNNPSRFSTIVLTLKSARKLTGRNLVNGKNEMNTLNIQTFKDQLYFPQLFTGLINYLILLEQLGSLFKIQGSKPSAEHNGITCSLNDFSDLSDMMKIKAIVALRNSLTHKFGLATERKRRRKKGKDSVYKFILSLDRNSEIIKLTEPGKEWNGIFSDKSDDSSTIVFLYDLIELVESVYTKIKEYNQENRLELKLEEDEIKARFTILI